MMFILKLKNTLVFARGKFICQKIQLLEDMWGITTLELCD